jgi:hypothetical protein
MSSDVGAVLPPSKSKSTDKLALLLSTADTFLRHQDASILSSVEISWVERGEDGSTLLPVVKISFK